MIGNFLPYHIRNSLDDDGPVYPDKQRNSEQLQTKGVPIGMDAKDKKDSMVSMIK
ncbi:MAG: hypothetical protein PWP59_1243 [Sphaerochaeta sp.]|nr:hypothetical protein [Sphaerochaeta sp.]